MPMSGNRDNWGRVGSVLAAAGMAGLALVVLAGIANRQGDRTISPVLVWVYFWLVVPFVAAGIGNWWRAISPWRKLAVVVNRGVPGETWKRLVALECGRRRSPS